MPAQCNGCRDGAAFELPFSMAFQPIVDIHVHVQFDDVRLEMGQQAEARMTGPKVVDPRDRY
jgi:hypothetical protein